MPEAGEIPRGNAAIWEELFSQSQAVYQYPADWLVRLWAVYLRRHLPTGRVLDYACGAGSNTVFLAEKGYDLYGADVAPSAVRLASAAFVERKLVEKPEERFVVVKPAGTAALPYANEFFDLILCSEALHYQDTKEAVRRVCSEFRRCLRPGGLVIVTMMGPRNVYIATYGKVIGENLYEVKVPDANRSLYGVRQYNTEPLRIYVIPDERELWQIFDMFEPLTVGHYDQAMFDLRSTFHWIFAGRKGNGC